MPAAPRGSDRGGWGEAASRAAGPSGGCEPGSRCRRAPRSRLPPPPAGSWQGPGARPAARGDTPASRKAPFRRRPEPRSPSLPKSPAVTCGCGSSSRSLGLALLQDACHGRGGGKRPLAPSPRTAAEGPAAAGSCARPRSPGTLP